MVVIRQETLHEVQDCLTDVGAIRGVLEAHPELTYEALLSHLSHRTTRRVKKAQPATKRNHGELTPDLVDALLTGRSLEAIAGSEMLPVSDLLRLMIPGLRDRGVLDPTLIDRGGSARRGGEVKLKDIVHCPVALREDVRGPVLRAVHADTLRSPAADEAAGLTGREYEHVLLRKLTARGIPATTEDELQRMGALKTPDVLLEVPIEVRGSAVTWIDSKATFADRVLFNELRDQLRGYVNRFGPGMVIFWFGFVDSLPKEDGVLVVDDFPAEFGTVVPQSDTGSHRANVSTVV